jgi:hypothetical protein
MLYTHVRLCYRGCVYREEREVMSRILAIAILLTNALAGYAVAFVDVFERQYALAACVGVFTFVFVLAVSHIIEDSR